MICKKYAAALLLGLILTANVCNAQDDKTKAFLFLSVFCEESDSYYEQSIDIVKDFYSQYDSFTYQCTKPIDMPIDTFSLGSLLGYDKYTVQLFKITMDTFSPSYYMLRLFPCDNSKFSFYDDLWIRICGYRESDLKVFFDELRKRGLKKKEISEMVDIWRSSDEMFREIDWNCLMKGYFKNDTRSSCYLSRANFWYNECFEGKKDGIYAVFSKRLLSGSLEGYNTID